ncbi:hypothetical protein [Roseivivax sp. CAU 1761]
MARSIKTTAIFLRSFQLPGFNETLPPGEYEVETYFLDPVNWIEPGDWRASVLLNLHPRASHPGLSRTLTVPLADLEFAIAKDKLTEQPLADFFLEEMLADPMIRLVMQADGVEPSEVRQLYSGARIGKHGTSTDKHQTQARSKAHSTDDHGPHFGSTRPKIGE